MKKLSILIFFVFVTFGYSQNKTNGLDKSNSSLVEVLVTMGISSATSTFSDNSYAANGSFFELSSTYYFSKIGLGASIGSFSNPTEGNLLDFANQAAYPIEVNSEKWKTSYYGIGPSYRTNIGELEAFIFTRAGIMSVKPINLEGNFNLENADVSTTIPVYNFSTKETTKTGFYSAGVRLGYKLNSNLGLYISANYLSAFSDEIIAQDGTKQFPDLNKDGVIDDVDIIRLNGEQVDFEYTDKKIQPQVFNYGFGLSYSFGQKPNNSSSRAQDHNASRSNTTSSRAQDHNASRSNTTSSRAQDHNASRSNTTSSRAQDHNASRSNTTSSKNSGSIVLTNLAKEKADKKDQQQKIISVLPKNNSVFKNSDELKKFTWKIIGTKIANPQFIIEVTKIGNNQQAQRTYIGKTTKTNINPSSVFKESKPSDGQYRWKVTETTTGNSSDVKFFTFSNCEIDFAISNEEIECLGYEGEKFRRSSMQLHDRHL